MSPHRAGAASTREAKLSFRRYFYGHTPPWSLEEIDVEVKQFEAGILELLREVVT